MHVPLPHKPPFISPGETFAPRATGVTLTSTHICVPQSHKFPLRKPIKRTWKRALIPSVQRGYPTRNQMTFFPHGAIKINMRQKSAGIERTITLGPVALGYRRASAIDGRQNYDCVEQWPGRQHSTYSSFGAFIFRPEIW